jgi:hypothetical protein
MACGLDGVERDPIRSSANIQSPVAPARRRSVLNALRGGGGVTAEIIEPKDVYKELYGNIIVTVRADKDGNKSWRFDTSKDSCQLTPKTFTPIQAPSGDIN